MDKTIHGMVFYPRFRSQALRTSSKHASIISRADMHRQSTTQYRIKHGKDATKLSEDAD